MEITKVCETPISKNPHGVDARQIYNHESAQVIVLTLQPGESLKRHITPVDVFFHILEGKGVVEVGDEKKGGLRRHNNPQSSQDYPLLAQQIKQ